MAGGVDWPQRVRRNARYSLKHPAEPCACLCTFIRQKDRQRDRGRGETGALSTRHFQSGGDHDEAEIWFAAVEVIWWRYETEEAWYMVYTG
jgi:hypothetical protein